MDSIAFDYFGDEEEEWKSVEGKKNSEPFFPVYAQSGAPKNVPIVQAWFLNRARISKDVLLSIKIRNTDSELC